MLAVLVLASGRAHAFHTIFDFAIDRFAADGNMLGPVGGAPDFVDEFDGTSTTNWYTPYGTSTVHDGRLHVQSPGQHFPGPDGLTLDFTEVASRYPEHGISKGAGDFTATAVFDAQIPPEGHFYHFTIYTFGGGTYFNELFGVDIQTLNGVSLIQQHLVILDLTQGIYQTVQTEGQVITADDLGSQVHLRVHYDDATGTIVSAFSLDDGVTFQSPFTPAPIFTLGRTLGQFILGADPCISAGPTTTTTTTTGATTTTDGVTTTTTSGSSTTSTLPLGSCHRTDCTQGKNRVDLRVRGSTQALKWLWRGDATTPSELGAPDQPDGAAYALCVEDGNGNVLFHDEVSPAGTCGTHPCWKVDASGARFRQTVAPGVRSLRIRAGSSTSITPRAQACPCRRRCPSPFSSRTRTAPAGAPSSTRAHACAARRPASVRRRLDARQRKRPKRRSTTTSDAGSTSRSHATPVIIVSPVRIEK